MPSNERRRCFIVWQPLVLRAVALLAFNQCAAQAPLPSLAASQIQTVEQLLRLDSQSALERLRERSGSNAGAGNASSRSVALPIAGFGTMPDHWQVLSIFGVAGEQRVDLGHNQKVFRGAVAGDVVDQLRIARIQGGCVSLSPIASDVLAATRPLRSPSNKSSAKPPIASTIAPEKSVQTLCFTDDRHGAPLRPEALPLPSLLAPMPVPMSSTGFVPSSP